MCFTLTLNQNVSSLHPLAFNFSFPSEAGERAKGDPLYLLPIAVLEITISLAA